MANTIDKIVDGIAKASCEIWEDQPLCEAAQRQAGVDSFENESTVTGKKRSFLREVFEIQYQGFQGLRNLLRPGCGRGETEKK